VRLRITAQWWWIRSLSPIMVDEVAVAIAKARLKTTLVTPKGSANMTLLKVGRLFRMRQRNSPG
jgi:hypothetical protein